MAIDLDSFATNPWPYVERYLIKTKSTYTKDTYRANINAYIDWCVSTEHSSIKATEYVVRLYLGELLEDKNYAVSSVKLKLMSIRLLYKVIKSLGIRKDDPTADIKIHVDATQQVAYKYLTIKQLKELIGAAGCGSWPERDTAIIYLMGVEGLRATEILRINRSDINWEDGSVRVKGKNREEVMLFSPETMTVLQRYENYLIDLNYKGNSFIISFAHANLYNPLTRIGLSRVIEKHMESIGLRVTGASCKLLRDSCGTILYQKYHDIGLVGKVLRHRNINYTEKYRTAGREVKRFTTGLLD